MVDSPDVEIRYFTNIKQVSLIYRRKQKSQRKDTTERNKDCFYKDWKISTLGNTGLDSGN